MDGTFSAPDHEIVIVGGGFSGIGASILLDRAGFSDQLVVEDGDGLGGAWHWNTYPGVGVDIPSFSYQFSFDQRADWSRIYAPGRELKAYAEDCARRFGVTARTRLNTRIVDAEFDETSDIWRLRTGDGDTISARYVVGATGVLTQPKRPDIDGLDDFAGDILHTARWDHDLDLRGRRVAVIGTGASAVQAIPEIAQVAEHLTVFQRTPIWCMPKPDAAIPGVVRTALGRIPGARRLARTLSQAFVEVNFPLPAHFNGVVPIATAGEKLARAYLRRTVTDPITREKLTPRYAMGCKRPSFSNAYLPTFNRDDVTLETTGIAAVEPTGVRTADGTLHECDVLVLATGFKVFEKGNMPPFGVRGVGGRDLDSWWSEHRLQAFHGVSVPGFPNFFTILGPYAYNGSSYFTLIETQSRHIARCLTRARSAGASRVEVTEQANADYLAEMLGRRDNQVFFQGGCGSANSYYFDDHGDVPFRASTTLETIWSSRRFDLDAYEFTRVSDRRTPAIG
ncbi:flavin-containing monooxygenase [Williamsia deligens]|uniref:Flavin-containing monooxygenase n=1 Tax=Williamsia deligens TaxID=321325 RepID=A0ABW3G3T1_9NOCA|nr:NAD(P)/FAD-dependent oxidoreductase [Williamsia deligens]MCP2194031.1 putative flavoprotein CzcO associated with the cation diffusion facilitator CzcD [Williamsia deligens]